MLRAGRWALMEETMDIRGVGIDVIEGGRIRDALARWGGSLTRRLFTPDEVKRAGPEATRAIRLAARFAAKEAVMKALGLGWRAMAFRGIEILHDEAGRPTVGLHGGAAPAAPAPGISPGLPSPP